MKKKFIKLIVLTVFVFSVTSIPKLVFADEPSLSDPSISSDGRYVAFTSDLPLVETDTNNESDIYVYDRNTAMFTLVSKPSLGESNAWSTRPKISGDGRYIVYMSTASNLVVGDTNESSDIFIYDRTINSTERISVNALDQELDGGSDRPSISDNGRYVAFSSSASNLLPESDGFNEIYILDRNDGSVKRIETDNDGMQIANNSDGFEISGDGRYVVFDSENDNLVIGDGNVLRDVFIWDNQEEMITRITVGGNNHSSYPSISSNGRYVIFSSSASNLTEGPIDLGEYETAVFIYDRDTNITKLISAVDGTSNQNGDGRSDNGDSSFGISSDGRYVAFTSGATNLVLGDTNDTSDIFVRDTQTNTTKRISLNTSGQELSGEAEIYSQALSGDGCIAVFGVTADSAGRASFGLGIAEIPDYGLDLYIRDLCATTTHTITFDSQGGVSVPSITTDDVSIILPSAPVRSGYIFQNWNTTPDGTGVAYSVGASYSAATNNTLYAIWNKVSKNSSVVGGVAYCTDDITTFCSPAKPVSVEVMTNKELKLGNGKQCSVALSLTQNLKAPSRNGVYNSYTKGIVKEVKILQAHLNRLGFNSGKVDGILGPISTGAIKRMQTFLGTKADGYVGPLTRALINNSCE